MGTLKFVFSLLMICAFNTSSVSQQNKFLALFVCKFVQYIEWPDNNEHITIGVAGNSTVFDELSIFAANKENLTIIKITSPKEVSKCQLIFLPSTLDKVATQYTQAIGTKSILLVSESGHMVGKGIDIGFYIESSKLRFSLSADHMRRKKIKPSNQLLLLGKSI